MLRDTFAHASLTFYHLTLDFLRFLGSLFQARSVLAAENLYLRKQLALYQERQVRPRRATDATRLVMVLVARLFDWKQALVTVRPETFIRWHAKASTYSGVGNRGRSVDLEFRRISGSSSWPRRETIPPGVKN
jgi:hypothetical protein